MELQDYLDFTKQIAKKAGDLLAQEFETRNISEFSIKEKGSIVTKADKISEEIILSAINEKYPEHAILSEEAGQNELQSDFLWIVDPLDGTTNFAIKNPFFNVSIALTYHGEVVVSCVYAPLLNEFYYASKGGGSFMNEKKLSVEKDLTTEKSFHGYCHGDELEWKIKALDYNKEMIVKNFRARQLGAMALEISRIASGILGSVYVPGANPWDVAGGMLILQEAGGMVTDEKGEKYSTSNPNQSFIASANNLIHKDVLNVINSL